MWMTFLPDLPAPPSAHRLPMCGRRRPHMRTTSSARSKLFSLITWSPVHFKMDVLSSQRADQALLKTSEIRIGLGGGGGGLGGPQLSASK